MMENRNDFNMLNRKMPAETTPAGKFISMQQRQTGPARPSRLNMKRGQSNHAHTRPHR
jgi:hypothetical protein